MKENYGIKDITDAEMARLARFAESAQLSLNTGQIYASRRGGELIISVSIDGLRVIAARSGQYEGQTPAQWCGEDGKWVDVWLDKKPPAAARIGVYRKGFREAMMAVATWDAYAQANSPTWRRMGPHMLAKCAEALALRKAFPMEVSGVYTAEEMGDEAQQLAAPASVPDKLGGIPHLWVARLGDLINALAAYGVDAIAEFNLPDPLQLLSRDSATALGKAMSKRIADERAAVMRQLIPMLDTADGMGLDPFESYEELSRETLASLSDVDLVEFKDELHEAMTAAASYDSIAGEIVT